MSRLRKILQAGMWIVVAAMVLLIAALLHVDRVGVPSWMVRRAVQKVEQDHDLSLTIEHVRLSPWGRVTLRDVSVIAPSARASARCASAVLYLGAEAGRVFPGRVDRCSIRDASIVFEASGGDAGPSVQVPAVDLVRTVEGGLHVLGKAGVGGWRFRLSGQAGPGPTGRTARAVSPADVLDRCGTALQTATQWREQGLLPNTMETRLDVTLDSSETNGVRVSARVVGSAVTVFGTPVESFSAAVRWEDEELHVDSFAASSPQAGLHVRGHADLVPESGNARLSGSIRVQPAAVVALHATRLGPMAPLVACSGPIDVNLHASVAVRTRSLQGLRFTAAAAGEASEPQGTLHVEHVVGSYTNGRLHIPQLRLVAEESTVEAFPPRWRESLSRLALHPRGRITADLALGPVPIASLPASLSGRLECADLEYKGRRVQQVSAELRCERGAVQIADWRGVLLEGPAPRTVRGAGTVLTNGAFRVQLSTDAEPGQFVSFVPDNVAPMIASLDVDGASYTDLQFSRGWAPETGTVVRAAIHVTDVRRNSTPLELLHATMDYRRGVVQCDDLVAVHAEGIATGSVAYDGRRRVLQLDCTSTMPPTDLARWIGPGLERAIQPYRIEGPVDLTARGVIGMRGEPMRDLRLGIVGESLGWRRLLLDRAALDVELGQDETVMTLDSGSWCGGSVTGSVSVARASGTNLSAGCKIDLQVADADLASAVDVFYDFAERRPYEGRVSGRLTLRGAVGPSFLQTMNGSGRIAIEDGYILSIPLFGGLSKYLSTIIPGVGFASQRDMHASVSIHDGRIDVSDAALLGRLMSIKGHGSYVPGGEVQARVQVQLLKDGLAASVVRFVTSPLTKALEFELTGTLNEPRWRPVNTPGRLLSFFNEQLGALKPGKQDRTDP